MIYVIVIEVGQNMKRRIRKASRSVFTKRQKLRPFQLIGFVLGVLDTLAGPVTAQLVMVE